VPISSARGRGPIAAIAAVHIRIWISSVHWIRRALVRRAKADVRSAIPLAIPVRVATPKSLPIPFDVAIAATISVVRVAVVVGMSVGKIATASCVLLSVLEAVAVPVIVRALVEVAAPAVIIGAVAVPARLRQRWRRRGQPSGHQNCRNRL